MAPLVTSSAINKGKTVAPKAIARRRPAAAAAAAQSKPQTFQQPVQDTQTSQQPVQDTAAGASQQDSQPSTAAPQSQTPIHSQAPAQNEPLIQAQITSAPLPTPPATQTQPTPSPQPPSAAVDTSPAVPASTLQGPPQSSPAPSQLTATQAPPSPTQLTAPESVRLPSPLPAPISVPNTQLPPSPASQSPNSLAGQKRKRATRNNVAETTTLASATTPVSAPNDSAEGPALSEPSAPKVALLNGIIAHHEQQRAPTAQMLPPPTPNPPKPRAKRQKKNAPAPTPTTEMNEDTTNATSGAQDETAPNAPAPKPKKPRAKRVPKSANRVVEDENGNVIESEEPVESERPAPKARKPRQKRQKSQSQEGGKDGHDQDEPVEDPENHEIDITVTTMSQLTRDRGLGKQSEREIKMAAIDWDEVYKKRLAEAEAIRAGQDPATANANPPQPTEGEGENSEETPIPQATVSGPRLRLDAEGNMIVDEESLRIDRQAEAARNAANLVVTENDDLTRRVNQMSWINERKRDPTDRVPFFKMKSDPWSDEETDRFYDSLRMFGTDFFIISKMFPPKTRRQIKLKFVREERLDPDRINKALAGEAVPMDIGSYAEATGQDLDNFKDPRELEEELRLEGEEQREEIARKKKEIEESKKQRDIQMAAREKEQADRTAQRREKAAMKSNRRKGVYGTGTF